jgi:transposase
MIEVAQYYLIKQLYEREGLSQREIAKRLNISRNTVRVYLQNGQVPTTVKRKESYGKRVLSPETLRVLPLIDQWLEDDRSVWKKQHHTAVRIYYRLVAEYQFRGAESTIRRVVRERRKQLQEVFIPLAFQTRSAFSIRLGRSRCGSTGRKSPDLLILHSVIC